MAPSIIDSLLGITTSQQQKNINSGEVHALWSALVVRYDIREANDIYENFANDVEWKVILAFGKRILDEEITQIENQMDKLGIALPPRPPKSINTPGNTEVMRDEFMFRTVYAGVQNFLEEHLRGLRMMQNQNLRDMLWAMMKTEMNWYFKLSDYGRLKGWLFIPPEYNPA